MSRREGWLLSALLLLLGVIAGGRAELQYVLSSPAALYSGETAKACVNIVGGKEKLDVRLILQHDGQNTSIIGEDVSSPMYFQCAGYKVPVAPNAVPVSLLLSVKGQQTEILERKTVVIQPIQNKCIFQMDKPIYKPSQNVFCRIICLNSQFMAVEQKFPTIYLLDPSRTRIKQWTNQETKRGVLSLDFKLISDAPPGSYSFVAERESSYSLYQWFTVDEYVPPRFSVTMESPDSVSALQDTLEFKVNAQYVFGEGVAGTVTILYCKESGLYGRRQNCFKEKGEVCFNMTGKLDRDGVFKGTIDLTSRTMGLAGMTVRIDGIVVEEGTGIQVSTSRYVFVTTQPARLSIDYSAMSQNYKRGIPFTVAARLSDEQDKPMPGQEIDIEVDQNLVQTVKTDSDGKINYGIDTSDMLAPNFTVRVSYKNPDQCYTADWRGTDYPTSEFTAYRFYSKTGSFLQAKSIEGELKCGETKNVEIYYAINQNVVDVETKQIRLYIMYKARGKLIQSAQQDVDLTISKNGSVTIPVQVTADMSPSANMIVYTIIDGELIVETVNLNIQKCFKNEVDMTFTSEKGLPGATAEVVITGDPDSICGLRVVDSSLLLLNSYERFSPDSIFGMFSHWSYGYNVAGFNVEDPEPPCLDPNKLVFFDGNYYVPVSSDSEGDSYSKLKDIGLIFATGAQVRKPKVCKPPEEFQHSISKAAPEAMKLSADARGFGGGAGGGAMVETIRTNFSETFMWFMVPLNKDGHASLTEQVPDTITKWEGTTFCLSDKGGFGMTKSPATYTTFLPFFVEVTKPYSVIREEIAMLVGVVQNYMDKCVKVQVTLAPSSAYDAELKEGTQDACLCNKERVTFSYEIHPKVLGQISFSMTAQTTFIGQSCDGPNDPSQPARKDTVVETMFVEPEGISQQQTSSNLISVKPGAKSTLPISITPPGNVVPGSLSAYIIAVGDVIGLPLKNLKDLVQKPYGCAEQNLARVAPIIHVLDYLNSTGQLTNEILEQGKQNILEGYYRHLGYASGNAYKVFRTSDFPSSWLTVYSFGTFEQAKRYIEIDETRQQQTLIWLENQQRLDNGCFQPQGSLFTYQDVNRNLHYTAYVAIALAESKYSLGKTLLEGALQCLKNASTTSQNIGDEVLMLYAFALANLPEYRDPLMEKLMKKAIIKDGTIHWESERRPTVRPFSIFWPIYPSGDVLITSYMLLSILKAATTPKTPPAEPPKNKRPPPPPPVVPEKSMTTMAQISLWLTRQQNGNGGFPSTTDTVVTLQALTAYGRLMYTRNARQTVTIKKDSGKVGSFNLNPENRLLVQRFDLTNAEGAYSIEVEGNGWSFTQIVLKYNVQIPKENAAFALAVSTASDTCLNGVTRAFNLTVTLSYQGNRNASGMALCKIRMPSGFHSDYWSLRELEKSKIISKGEENVRGEVEIYLESVGKEPITFTFKALMGQRVLNIKTNSAVVYDYYQQGENGYAAYELPCGKQQ